MCTVKQDRKENAVQCGGTYFSFIAIRNTSFGGRGEYHFCVKATGHPQRKSPKGTFLLYNVFKSSQFLRVKIQRDMKLVITIFLCYCSLAKTAVPARWQSWQIQLLHSVGTHSGYQRIALVPFRAFPGLCRRASRNLLSGWDVQMQIEMCTAFFSFHGILQVWHVNIPYALS